MFIIYNEQAENPYQSVRTVQMFPLINLNINPGGLLKNKVVNTHLEVEFEFHAFQRLHQKCVCVCVYAVSFRFQFFMVRERFLGTNCIEFWTSSKVGTEKVTKSKFPPRVEIRILIVHFLPCTISSRTKAGRIFPNVRKNFIRLVTEVKEKIQHLLKFLHELRNIVYIFFICFIDPASQYNLRQ